MNRAYTCLITSQCCHGTRTPRFENVQKRTPWQRTYDANTSQMFAISTPFGCPACAVVGTLASHLGDPGALPVPGLWVWLVVTIPDRWVPSENSGFPHNTRPHQKLIKLSVTTK
ncbi:hypothetical protein DPMN_185422 [Dreissena polymorpha]|uniref:Uncharacterized protein n=1 Tax=Dreissena polymorpha TaxID=45954 RepID=A0A9D4DLD8_DREPO|nr:hypothetical protein DPMN_185422 [Dreissena polymorpha]